MKTPLEIAKTSKALQFQHVCDDSRSSYPPKYRGRVPLKVKMAKTVKPDLPQFHKVLNVPDNLVAHFDHEYYVYVNSLGAVCAIMSDGSKLGLLPCEFDVVEWHPEENLIKTTNKL